MAQFPSKEIAQGSYEYRTLGLGYANLGSLLMRKGIAYDSDLGRTIAGALTAILTENLIKHLQKWQELLVLFLSMKKIKRIC